MTIRGTLKVQGANLYYKVRGSGPTLLVLQGGAGNADASDGIASVLEHTFTTISYDRRGLLRSPLDDPRQPLTVEQHAEDARELIRTLASGPVFAFGSSVGASIGLELLARSPDQIAMLVAHEPPAVDLLTGAWRERYDQLCCEIRDAALREGPRQALRIQVTGLGIDGEDREDDAEPPASGRIQSKETTFLLTREARAIERYRLKLEVLREHSDKVVCAFGASSREYYPAQCAMALAAAIGSASKEFPGGHTGYVLRPRAFAQTLETVLVTKRESERRLTVPLGPQDQLRELVNPEAAVPIKRH